MGHSCCGNNLKALFDHALLLQKQENFEEASEHYQKIIEEFPSHTESHYNLAYVLSQLQDFDKAIAVLQTVIAQQPKFAPAYFNLAINQLAKNQINDAMESLETAIGINPSYSQAKLILGCLYLEKENFEEAREIIEPLRDADPHNIEIVHTLGLIYLGLQDLDKARDYFLQAIKIDPKLIEAHYNLGVIASEDGKVEDAISAYEHCLSLNENYYPALFNLARIYHEQRDIPQAIAFYQRAKTQAPQDASILYLLSAIDAQALPVDTAPAEYVTQLFDSYANRYEQTMQEQLAYAAPDLLFDALSRRLLSTRLYRILDLGCGTGLVGEKFITYSSELTGIDLSAQMLIQAQLKNCYSHLETAEILTYLRQHYRKQDIILAADVLPYFGALDELFALIARSLEIEGYFAFTIESWSGDKDYQLQPSARFAHNPVYIERLADENALKVISNTAVNLRKHHGDWIAGNVFVLQR